MRRVDAEIDGAVARLTAAAMAAAGVRDRAEAGAVIDEVVRVAAEWHAGRMHLEAAAGLHTPAERFLAARFVRPQPPALRAFFDALCCLDGRVFSRHGWVCSDAEPSAVAHRRVYEDGPGGVRRAVATFVATVDEVSRRPAGARTGTVATRRARYEREGDGR